MEDWLSRVLDSTWFKDHQTFVAAMLALFGVGITAMLNARFARHRDKVLRRDDAVATAAILLAEVKVLAARAHDYRNHSEVSTQSGAEQVANTDGVETDPAPVIGRLFEDLAYSKLVDKLGLLGPNRCEMISEFYANYRLVRDQATTGKGKKHLERMDRLKLNFDRIEQLRKDLEVNLGQFIDRNRVKIGRWRFPRFYRLCENSPVVEPNERS